VSATIAVINAYIGSTGTTTRSRSIPGAMAARNAESAADISKFLAMLLGFGLWVVMTRGSHDSNS